MAQCYGITLRFQGNGTWGSVEHPGSADLSRMMGSEASEVIGRVSRGWGCKTQVAPVCAVLVGKRGSVEVNRKALS